jgi:muramoyltetrapeptide carboxypeptidase LdcA involved in peptidoglycan recycling
VTARELVYPPKPSSGDRVAVISPSDGLPEIFPAPFDLGLHRLREDFGLEPVEYPTTRRMGSSLEARAADVHAAFADPGIAAVLTSIGGDDQIKLLRLLDRDLLRDNPKPFFGWSDNTNLLHLLWNLGIVGYHGGAVMVQFGRAGAVHPATGASLHRALFTHDEFELSQPAVFTDEDRDWGRSHRAHRGAAEAGGHAVVVARPPVGGRGPLVGRLPGDRRLPPARGAVRA